ncbi:helix-turn-helix transcriptional regulator [Undibacter mobilis]|uniref:DNA-binding protein n=1 Tax=Undibacter mobilis TaxID=2292256 RepID=A0A371BA81_9BRAD|nr:helix-turn-helix domain-containing protein [Undibacter mobilis]RDV04519.1 DNA-binding protein [Undibacter mobilis]
MAKLLDQNQVSERWGVSVRTLERYRLTGTGPRFIRIGRLVRYRESDLEEYVFDHVRTSTSQSKVKV